MTSLWLNVVSNTPNDAAIPKDKRKFWVADSGSEEEMLEDAKTYPHAGRCGDDVYYIETIEVHLGTGYDVIAQAEENWRSLRTWLPKVPA